MLNEKDLQELRKVLKEAFPERDDITINQMVDDLNNRPGVTTTFCQIINNHITKVGVKQKFSETCWGRYYYSTQYDSDLFDD